MSACNRLSHFIRSEYVTLHSVSPLSSHVLHIAAHLTGVSERADSGSAVGGNVALTASDPRRDTFLPRVGHL